MTAYYNENDPKAAEWLRQLIMEDCIAPGDVDERSIADVTPADLSGYEQHHFFAGIGGWSYALRLAGWPDDRPVWTGSCPCQPFSVAGAQRGVDDERHLWPIWRWLIDQRRPAVVFGEQVASKSGRGWLGGVRTDMEALGYGVGGADLCAAGIGAPHIRQRLWWVANAEDANWRRGESVQETGTRANEIGRRGSRVSGAHCRMGDALEPGLERHPGHEPDRHESGRIDTQSDRPATEAGGDSRMGNPASDDERRDSMPRENREGLANRGPGSNSWAGTYIPCADGKARRIKPDLEPLVNGLSGRVGLLRGYGNAIVPQLASEVVSAYMDLDGDRET